MKSTIKKILKEESMLYEYFSPKYSKSFTSYINSLDLKEPEKKLIFKVVEQILNSVEIIKNNNGTFIHINDLPTVYGTSVPQYRILTPQEKYDDFLNSSLQPVLQAMLVYFRKYLEIVEPTLPLASTYGIFEGLYRKYFLTKKV